MCNGWLTCIRARYHCAVYLKLAPAVPCVLRPLCSRRSDLGTFSEHLAPAAAYVLTLLWFHGVRTVTPVPVCVMFAAA